MGVIEPEFVTAIDKQVRGLRRTCEHCNSLLHCALGGCEDAETVDVRGAAETDACCAVLLYPQERLLSLLRLQCFTVADEGGDAGAFRKNARSSYDRAGKRSSACFVDAGSKTGSFQSV